uniref:Uncharacterized protein n=1 Tax=Helianthus annuus TaxID=4232 RepID=A0A251UZY0_HELAN
MFTMRSVARVVLGLRLIDTPQSIKPWWENQRLYFEQEESYIGFLRLSILKRKPFNLICLRVLHRFPKLICFKEVVVSVGYLPLCL